MYIYTVEMKLIHRQGSHLKTAKRRQKTALLFLILPLKTPTIVTRNTFTAAVKQSILYPVPHNCRALWQKPSVLIIMVNQPWLSCA